MVVMRLMAMVLAVVAVAVIPLGHGFYDDQSPEAVAKWFQEFPAAKPKLTKLHFYLHNMVSRKPPDSTPIAQANITASSPTQFGLLNVIDGPLTEEPGSRVFGYCQGLFAFSSFEERSTIMTLTFVFTGGKYKGSTLTVLGRNAVTRKFREFPITGGTGQFRLARGSGICSTYFMNATSGDDVLGVDFIFYRYTLPGDSMLMNNEGWHRKFD